MRAAAAAASVPAWPPPTTITSKWPSITGSARGLVANGQKGVKTQLFHVKQLFPDAKVPENDVQDVFHIDLAGEAAQCPTRQPELLGNQLLAGNGRLQSPGQPFHGRGQMGSVPLAGNQARFP